jgi:hypothetical protein
MKLKQHHTWLFCFTDLAFLLLISLSLVPSAPEDPQIHFSLMEVPGVPENPNLSALPRSEELWELHVYGENPDLHPKPFKLIGAVRGQAASEPLYAKYLEKDELLEELLLLRERNFRPVLIPSKSSLSHDFLFAAGAIAKTWDSNRSETIVKPLNPDEEYRE